MRLSHKALINVPVAHFHFLSAEDTIIIGVPGHVYHTKSLQNYFQIYAILMLSLTTFKVIFV